MEMEDDIMSIMCIDDKMSETQIMKDIQKSDEYII